MENGKFRKLSEYFDCTAGNKRAWDSKRSESRAGFLNGGDWTLCRRYWSRKRQAQ